MKWLSVKSKKYSNTNESLMYLSKKLGTKFFYLEKPLHLLFFTMACICSNVLFSNDYDSTIFGIDREPLKPLTLGLATL